MGAGPIGIGTLVNKDIPDYTLVYGALAKIQGWICYCGVKLNFSNKTDSNENSKCNICGREYKIKPELFTKYIIHNTKNRPFC